MKPLLLTFLLLTSTVAAAQNSVTRVGAAPFSSGGWSLNCTPDQCSATSGLVTIVCKGGELSVHALEDFEVQHWHNRTAQPLPMGTPLDAFGRETLLSGGQLVLISPSDPSVAGIVGNSLEGLLDLLSPINTAAACDLETNPMGYRVLLDDPRYAGRDQLVPFTKPQIEFAVRAQTNSTD